MSRTTALIFGCSGQDGSFLSELLLNKRYSVVGVTRRTSTNNTERIAHLMKEDGLKVEFGDVTDYASVSHLINKWQPQEIYNLAAMSQVGISFDQPFLTTDIVYKGCLNILEVLRIQKEHASIRLPKFYQASSSELFGSSRDQDGFQRETTPFLPNSPYAIAKLAAHNATRLYREAYGLFACSGILFNHESPRRGEQFVTRKITQYVAAYALARGQGRTIPPLLLGSLSSKRDWSHAKDMVYGMWLMLQQDRPDDYVLASGNTYSVEDFLKASFAEIGVYDLLGLYEVDRSLFRPLEVPLLCGDAGKARKVLGWEPTVTFNELVKEMVQADYERLKLAGIQEVAKCSVSPR